jgi:xanthine dehydrogenase small subunit
VRKSVRFVLGQELREVAPDDPSRTVLDWLRLDARMTGTKEGCAEGDCGACTIVVGTLRGGTVRYEAINACIRLLATLDGCHVLTIDHLAGADGVPHPVQQAMVEAHGSQCGFCTPGIVMSLYALWLNEPRPSEARIDDVLAGNLCRCTGYAPIVEAARRMYALGDPARDPNTRDRAGIADRLLGLRDAQTIKIGDGARRFYAPASEDALAKLLLSHPGATLLAGSTDVGLWITKEMRILDPIIALQRIDSLRRVEDKGDHLHLGAMASLAEARGALGALHPHVDELMRRFAGEQIRNAGTVGGNIANGSPIGDLAPVLMALGATVVLRRGSKRRGVALKDFFLAYKQQDRQPDEFVEALLVQKLTSDSLYHVSKVSKRFDEDISAVCGAFHLRLGGDGRIAEARIAFGGMAATPKRAPATEATLIGKPWGAAAAEAAGRAVARDFQPISDLRASARYRLVVAANLLRRFHLETVEPRARTRVAGSVGSTVHA